MMHFAEEVYQTVHDAIFRADLECYLARLIAGVFAMGCALLIDDATLLLIAAFLVGVSARGIYEIRSDADDDDYDPWDTSDWGDGHE